MPKTRFALRSFVALWIVMLALAAGVVAQAQTSQSLYATAAADGRFSEFVRLVDAAGLREGLDGEATWTVFAPTNDAIAAVPAFIIDYLTLNPDALRRLLNYHLVAGQVLAAADVAAQTSLTSFEGGALAVRATADGVVIDNATIIAVDITASNGVIHALDAVLIPEITLDTVSPIDYDEDIVIAGSSTVFPITEGITEDFEAEGYRGTFTLESVGTGRGFERFCVAGDIDISNASRPINDEEIAACAALPTPRFPVEFRVGTDALAVVVHPSNTFVETATLEQLAQIFATAETWADVDPGWPAEPIYRFIPGTDSGTFDYFVEEVFDEDPTAILAASNRTLSEDDLVLEQGVANQPFAIGFFGYAYYAQNAAELRILPIDGVEATQENVDNATYPLARPLFVYSDAGVIAQKPTVGQFISYYLTNADRVVEAVGYFPANPYALRLAKLSVLALID